MNEYRETKDFETGDHRIVRSCSARSFEAFERMVFRYDPFQFQE